VKDEKEYVVIISYIIFKGKEKSGLFQIVNLLTEVVKIPVRW
jgi:hypothetical protein